MSDLDLLLESVREMQGRKPGQKRYGEPIRHVTKRGAAHGQILAELRKLKKQFDHVEQAINNAPSDTFTPAEERVIEKIKEILNGAQGFVGVAGMFIKALRNAGPQRHSKARAALTRLMEVAGWISKAYHELDRMVPK